MIPTTASELVVKALKEKHEELMAKGLSDEDIQKSLADLYAILIAAEDQAKSMIVTETKPKPNPHGKISRRRSFENKNMKPKPASTDKIANSQSLGVLPKIEATGSSDATDHWDSVIEQPFCDICNMAFKSVTFLERHVKYSDLHKNNLSKPEKDSPELTKVVEQVEGEHYKLIYCGSKLFWRSQENIDFHFYHHLLPNTIEVIAFDPEKHKELNRLYFDYLEVTKSIDSSVIEEIKEKMKERLEIEEIDAAANEPREGIVRVSSQTDLVKIENATRVAVTNFLLHRLQKQIGLPEVAFAPSSTDDSHSNVVLVTHPPSLVPINVQRKRRSNAEEIKTAITGLAASQLELKVATDKAEKIANLMHESATSLLKKKWWSGFSLPRRRWIMGCRRIIRRGLVKVTQAHLDKLGMKYYAKPRRSW